MILLTSLNNANLLRALEVFVVIAVWLFLFRVVRAVWVEVMPPRPCRPSRKSPPSGPNHSAGSPGPGRSTRRSNRSLRLRTVEPETQRGRIYEVDDEVTIGRAAGCGVRVEDTYTSTLHARLYRRDGGLWVEDLGSTNGTWVNTKQVTGPTRLGRGDLLQVGGTVFEIAR